MRDDRDDRDTRDGRLRSAWDSGRDAQDADTQNPGPHDREPQEDGLHGTGPGSPPEPDPFAAYQDRPGREPPAAKKLRREIQNDKNLERRGWLWGAMAPVLLALLLLWNSVYSSPAASGSGVVWILLLMAGWVFALVMSIHWLWTVLHRWQSFPRKPVVQTLLNLLPTLGLLYYLYVSFR